jgi:AraC-like DNA-binding protein
MDEGQQRVGFLVEVPHLLREMGIDPVGVVARAGLPLEILGHEENSITIVERGRLYHACVEETGCLHFGLLIGQRVGTARLGLVGRLMQNAPTFGDAIRDLVAFQHRYVRGAVVYLLVQGETAFWGYAVYQSNAPATDQVCDVTLTAGFNMVRELSHGRPDDILLGHAAPAEVGPYRRYFGMTPLFDADQYALALPLSSLKTPVPGADPQLRRRLEQSVASYWATREPTVAEQVVRLIRPRMMSGEVTLEVVADGLAMHSRTLNRRLSEEGASFRQLMNDTRFEVSRQMLQNTRVSVTEIGLALGYADASGFTHAFRRSTGMAPIEWRKQFQRNP